MTRTGRGKTNNTPAQEIWSPRDGKAWIQQQVRVLVVDDDYDIRETLRIVLEDEGYLVDEASNGKTCLDLLRAAVAPYVVVLDLMMPQLGGAAVLRIVSQDERLVQRHALLLVTASTYTGEEHLAEVLQRFRIPLIRKPYDLDILVSLVDKAALRIGRDVFGTTL